MDEELAEKFVERAKEVGRLATEVVGIWTEQTSDEFILHIKTGCLWRLEQEVEDTLLFWENVLKTCIEMED